jgi:small-conductance mechanosensitive channel
MDRQKKSAMSPLIRSIILPAFLIFILLFWMPDHIGAGQRQSNLSMDKAEKVQLPPRLDTNRINSFLATLSDEQVRRLLIEELQKKATLEAAVSNKSKEDTGFLSGVIQGMRSMVGYIRERIRFLLSGASAAHEELPRAVVSLMQSNGKFDFFKTLGSVIAVFAAALMIDWLFRRLTTPGRKRIETTPPVNPMDKMRGLALISILDFASICVFTFATLAIFFLFFDDSGQQRLVTATYLAAFLIARAVRMASCFLLSPSAPALRLVPLSDESAVYLHKWVVRISVIAGFGWLTCGLLALRQISEANNLLMIALVGAVIILMLAIIILQKREPLGRALHRNLPDSGLGAHLADAWWKFALFYLFIIWGVWVIGLLLVGPRAVLPAVATLLSVPVFFLLDRGLQALLNIADRYSCTPINNEISGSSGDREMISKPNNLGDPEKAERSKMNRHIPMVRHFFRILLLAGFFFLILRLWGIDLYFARIFTRTAMAVLLTIVLAFVAWEYAKARIDQKLCEELPEDGRKRNKEEGGGSRRLTLLVLLRKFILAVLLVMVVMIVLSAIGVNIGPLIAGAGIVGLAIGFGAQTLVKDIISGVFFLIDDAFRVGDYVETGSAKGTVEHISLRTLRLRHHRGPIHTIPFGEMKSITNYSRDYIITKLDFRVRYDTDIDQVRKIIKKIDKDISKDKELGPSLLDSIKSQGVKELDDSAMIMRLKFKTVPGEQFIIRREVYKRLQEAFREHGIAFAHRNVTVYPPPETTSAASGTQGEDGAPAGAPDKKKIEAAAAAAIAADLDDQKKDQNGS